MRPRLATVDEKALFQRRRVGRSSGKQAREDWERLTWLTSGWPIVFAAPPSPASRHPTGRQDPSAFS